MYDDDQTFEVTEEHIKLLRRAYVSWNDCEHGAPEINPKRPYGNSDVASDVVEILGLELTDFVEYDEILRLEEGELPESMHDYCEALHLDTQTALQIFLSTGTMEPGIYNGDWTGHRWTKLG